MSAPLLSADEALRTVLQQAASLLAPQRHEQVPLDEASGRILAVDLCADRDQPPFNRSTRDGFAIQATDLSTSPAVGALFRVTGSLRAGETWAGGPLQHGEAIEIMTGAPLPQGADTVVMLEYVDRIAGDQISLRNTHTVSRGEHVVQQGSEAREGDAVLSAGTRMGAAEIALAASIGATEITVFARPRVAVLATGDELVDSTRTPTASQVRNSNSHGIAELVRACGGEAILSAPVPDTLNAVVAAIEDARGADFLILSGGVSAGAYDFVEAALLQHGAEFFFTGVRIQPGKPTVFGRLAATDHHPAQYFFGLPGNPVSTQVTFLLFANPLLRALAGETGAAPRFVRATLAHDFKTKRGLTRFLPAQMESTLHETHVRLTGWQGSGDLAANARANCYAILPPEKDELHAGDTVSVLLR